MKKNVLKENHLNNKLLTGHRFESCRACQNNSSIYLYRRYYMEDRIPVNNIDIKYSDLTTSYISKFVKIVDIESNKILCMGKVINVKLTYPCISIDNKHFFKILIL